MDWEEKSIGLPKVSIIIPIYNVEDYLKFCLESVMQQTLKEIEIICIDDASTDDSYKIAQKCIKDDSRFRLFQLERNSGLSYVRNYGMKKARGKYLYFLDSDDYLDRDALKILYEYAEYTDIQGIFFGAYVEYEDAPEIKESITYSNCGRIVTGREFFIEVNKGNEYQNAVCFQFWNRKYIMENSFCFYEGIEYEDAIYTLQILMKANKVVCIADKLYHYRKRRMSTTGRKGKEQLRSYMIVYFEILKIWLQSKNANEIAEGIQKRLAVYHRRISMAIGQLGYIPDLQFQESVCQYLYKQITLIQPDYQYINNVVDRDMQKKLSKADYIFVYGAGIIADEVIRLLEGNGQKIEGVIVSKREIGQSSYKGYFIYEMEEIKKYQGEIVVVLALSRKYHNEIKKKIEKAGYAWYDALK